MDVLAHNRKVWNSHVDSGNEWTVPVGPEIIDAARQGSFEIVLTPTKPVPKEWFPPLIGAKVLGLASGGGQQCPILAAAGALVTSFDNSTKQLAQDLFVAERDGLEIETIEGDMADLSMLQNDRFDLIINPVSTVFAQAVRPIWKECARVLKRGGVLLTGFMNPIVYALDEEREIAGTLILKHRLPYSDLRSQSPEHLIEKAKRGEAIEFGHTLEDLIGGQVDAGLAVTGFYEDDWKSVRTPLSQLMNPFYATRAIKL